MIKKSNNTNQNFENLVSYTLEGVEYMIPVGRESRAEFAHASCVINDIDLMYSSEKNRLFADEIKQIDLNFKFYDISLGEEDEITAYLYREGEGMPISQGVVYKEYRDIKITFSNFFSENNIGNYFLLIGELDPKFNYEKFSVMGNCLRYSFRLLPHGESLFHPEIKEVKIKPAHSGMRFNSGGISISFNTDINISKYDVFTLSCYNHDLFQMCETSMKVNAKKKRNLIAMLSSSLIWLPGEYTCYLSHNDDVFKKITFKIDENNSFSHKIAKVTPQMRDYFLIKHLEKESHDWARLRNSIGYGSLKNAILDNYPLIVFNRKRNRYTQYSIDNNFNFAIIGRNDDDSENLVSNFVGVFSPDTFLYRDCKELLSTCDNDSYESIKNLFSLAEDNIICFTGLSAINTSVGSNLLSKIEQRLRNKPDNPVILFGTETEIEQVFELNPALRKYYPINHFIHLSSMGYYEIIHNLQKELEKQGLEMSSKTEDMVTRFFMSVCNENKLPQWAIDDIRDFINCSIIPRFTSRMMRKKICDITRYKILQPSDFDFDAIKSADTIFEDSIKTLNSMVGLKNIKQNLLTTFNNIKLNAIRQKFGLKSHSLSCHHMIFTGNPGTGKTSVAKMIGRIYHSLGILSKGDVIITERSRMVGRYIGETEQNMNILLQKAQGNVLFVDEAYTLYDGTDDHKDFGYHALESLLTILSQKNPDMIIIFAGYKKEIENMLQANQGLSGRFPYHFHFDDYSAEELMQIALDILSEKEYMLLPDAENMLFETIQETVKTKSEDFSNARWITQYIENGIIPALGDRLVSSVDSIDKRACQTITCDDIEVAYEKFALDNTVCKSKEYIHFDRFRALPRVGFKIA